MAILQISRITNRKGLEVDLPDPLAGAELGWCTDTRKLFIGNGDLADGAPEVGNTEILTEFSDILGLVTAYTYKGEAAGYVVQTGPTPGTPVVQSLQSRLDSYCIATDFGIVGDGATDNTAAINRALYQLYCVDNNPLIRRSLFFPAGQYVISNTINIPPYVTLYGEGINNSIISLVIQTWDLGTAYAEDVTVVDSGTYYNSNVAVPANTDISDTYFWTEVPAPEYVWRTADSRQQIDTEIGANGATPPTSIEIVNMKFTTSSTAVEGCLIQDATQMTLDHVAFEGPLTQQDIIDGVSGATLPQIAAIRWASTPALVCSNIIISGCSFHGYAFGTNTVDQIKAVTISNSSFDTLFQGIVLGDSVVINGGPSGVRIISNNFDHIFAQGVVFENISLNATGYNVFYDVGNEFNGIDYPSTSIIDIDADDNICVGDLFQRTTTIVEQYSLPRIQYYNRPNISTVNGYRSNFGTYTRYSGLQVTLTNNTSDVILFTTDANLVRAFKIDYTVVRNQTTRTGSFTVVASTDGTGGNLTYNDNGYENADTGVTFSASETLSSVSVLYSVTDLDPDLNAVLNYSVTKLA